MVEYWSGMHKVLGSSSSTESIKRCRQRPGPPRDSRGLVHAKGLAWQVWEQEQRALGKRNDHIDTGTRVLLHCAQVS